MKDIVFQICEQMLANSPEASYKRLNPALRSTLRNCIEADLPFQRNTFQRICNELRGGWWFGDGAGSHLGEHFYTLACGCNHASAQQSFEAFAERPGVLWEENVGTPSRLHVGSQFTWRGHYVTVTSMRKDSLVACTYKGHRNSVEGIKVGATIGYGPKYLITSAKREGAATVLRVVKAKGRGESEVAKRFTIRYDEIKELRQSAKARVKALMEKIAECDPEKDLAKLTKEINTAHFRHFELEEIQAAFQKRKGWVAGEDERKALAERIEQWRNGKEGAWIGTHQGVMLRVKGDRVECSNGNGVSKAAAVRVLPVLLDNRRKTVALNVPVDSYTVNRVSSAGVNIGCTLVPWEEVDRIVPQLQAA